MSKSSSDLYELLDRLSAPISDAVSVKSILSPLLPRKPNPNVDLRASIRDLTLACALLSASQSSEHELLTWIPKQRTRLRNLEDVSASVYTNPEAAPFRYKELQFTEKLEIIFDGTAVTGETEPPTKRSKTNENSSASVLNIDKHSTGNHNQARNFEQYDVVPISFKQPKLAYSIGECIDCLDAMEEVVQGSDLYLFALDVFLKKEYREIFLQLKKPNARIAWLQRLQAVDPPLV